MSNFFIKIIGNQWYWTYEIHNFRTNQTIIFDSYMKAIEDLKKGEFRNLTVDNELFLPIKTKLSLIVTSNDVIHSWSVPSFGIKIDAIPGRLNLVNLYILRFGMFYGQCSELCGINHGFMPINVLSLPFRNFLYKFYNFDIN